MSDIGVEVDKDCDYCGRPIFDWRGKPGNKGYHIRCLTKVNNERSKIKAKLKRKLKKSIIP